MLVLDLLVTAAVLSIVLAMLLPEVGPAVFKARFVNVLSAMAFERVALIEHYAHAGAWSGPDGAGSSESEGRPESSLGGYQVISAEGKVVAAGALSGRALFGGMRPGVADPASHWSVLWLCGTRQPPPGWTVPPGSVQFSLPQPLVPSVCREAKA